MYYMLVKVEDDPKNYFIKSKYPFYNTQTMLNKMSFKYDVWDKDLFTGKYLNFFQYYSAIALDKMLNKIIV